MSSYIVGWCRGCDGHGRLVGATADTRWPLCVHCATLDPEYVCHACHVIFSVVAPCEHFGAPYAEPNAEELADARQRILDWEEAMVNGEEWAEALELCELVGPIRPPESWPS